MSSGYHIPYASQDNAERKISAMSLTSGTSTNSRMAELSDVPRHPTQNATLNNLDAMHQKEHKKFAIIGDNARSRLSAWNAKIYANDGSIYQDDGYKIMMAENPFDTYITGGKNLVQSPVIIADRIEPLSWRDTQQELVRRDRTKFGVNEQN